MDEEILKTVRENGLLLETDVYTLLNGFGSVEFAREFLETLVKVSGQKLITKGTITKNIEFVRGVVNKLSDERHSVVDKIFVNLGISLEVSRERELIKSLPSKEEKRINQDFQIFYAETTPYKKIQVEDFVGHFRARFHQLQKILMQRPEMQQNLLSISKISSQRSSLGIIGIVKDKRVTKNKNLIITFEDLTGEISALVKFDNKEIFEKVEELQLDDIVGVRASGNRDLLFIYDIFFPESFLHSKSFFDEDINVAFISDIHCGSNKHLGQSFNKFLEWINSDDGDAKKIKYLFIVGDTVDGVGIFPGQENLLTLKSMGEQYSLLASYLRKIPKHITMFLCPGQHDAVRVAEPQPIIGRKYASELYNIENLILVTNPTLIKLIEGNKEFKVLMYHGASIHALINEIKELRELKAHGCPAKAVKHMLKRRHLAPMHGVSTSIVYVPNEKCDPLVISEVPDILATGEVHRLDIDNHNGVLIITGSCWQSQTPFEEKVGNVPDPAKVPVFNLKTRTLKVFDFGIEEEINGGS
ncbi:MAG: metallophosphoesterase [Nanoarchaeota archaeon]|nr:metallophosphoesterase [Nanoarchaeota archaeon]